ncbi:MAG: putative transcriptional regulator [Neolewinella sp.]|jgi:predicted transcriptional regulator
MKKLAKREAQIMQAIWELKHAFVKDIVERYGVGTAIMR